MSFRKGVCKLLAMFVSFGGFVWDTVAGQEALLMIANSSACLKFS